VIVNRPRLFPPPLAPFELAWTDAAFDAIYPEPPESALPHGVLSMHPARFFDGVLASIPFEQAFGLRVTLWMIALAPLFTIRRLGTIASISAADRVRVLAKLVTSSNYFVRQLAMSFKAVATLLYAKSDAVRAAMSKPLLAPLAFESGARASDGQLVSATRLTSRAKTTPVAGGMHDHAAE
jgi:hypothetical protein